MNQQALQSSGIFQISTGCLIEQLKSKNLGDGVFSESDLWLGTMKQTLHAASLEVGRADGSSHWPGLCCPQMQGKMWTHC